MTVEYTVYANIEAYDESMANTDEDDTWHPADEIILGVFDSLKEAQAFLDDLPEKPI